MRGAAYAAMCEAASSHQWSSACALKELARGLRSPLEDLEALRAARMQVERLIDRQVGLRTDTAVPLPAQSAWDAVERRGADLSARQARIEFDTRDTRARIKTYATVVAGKIEPAELEMRAAQKGLRWSTPSEAAQDRAIAILKSVLEEIDKLIVEAEKALQDPLAALEKAMEELDELIKAEQELLGKTKTGADLAKLAQIQEEIQKRTLALAQKPLPSAATIRPALTQAAQAMAQAKAAMAAQMVPQANTQQQKAIQA
ncbi:MAG: hypothetical protein AAB295_07520, partial [Chloroflexota bacterium]